MHNPSQQLTFEEEWKEFFGQRINLELIEKSCLNGKLRGSHVRSIVWRILLKCLPLERDEWCTILSRTRTAYSKIKSELITNPREQTSGLDPNVSNPLSLGDENPWQQYFADCELRECINRDVARTFPELQYFKEEKVRSMMSDILFIYAKRNPDIAYRQGMHEILAPLIFVLNFDHRSFAHLMEQNGFEKLPSEELKILCAVNNQDYLEHDSFDIFTQLMMMLGRWYLAGDEGYMEEHSADPMKNNRNLISTVPFRSTEDADPKSELIIKLRSIICDILAVVDPALHHHLLELQILPQIYGIRWLRLLFGREFPIHDLLFVWDAIFAFRPPLSLVDYVFVAMLEQIRNLLIDEDYSTTLQYLMRYPPVADVHSLIQFALHIKSPKKFGRPRTPNVSNFENITVAGMIHPNRDRDTEGKNTVGKPKVTTPGKQISSPKRMFFNMNEIKQQGDAKSFVAKIVDTISDRTVSGKGLDHSPLHAGGRTVAAAPDTAVQLLQEQVSCLQSRLNDMDMMASVVRQRIDSLLSEKLPKIVGNDVLKETIAEELRSVRLQIGNAARTSVGNQRNMVATSSMYSGRDIHGSTGINDIVEVGNEACPTAVQQQHQQHSRSCPERSPAQIRQRTSRVETEMREIRHRSVVL